MTRAAAVPSEPAPATSAGALAERFRAVRTATTALAAPLSPEDCQVQSMADASPVKWHLAHTTWFFETFVLERAEPAFAPFDPAFRVLFNSYYNTVGPQHARPARGLVSRPSLGAVQDYRAAVDARVLAWLERGAAPEALLRTVELGLHHEQQHQELILTDVKHALAQSPLRPAYRELAEAPRGEVAPLRYETFAEGVRWIGHGGDGFAFDNEGPRHRVLLSPVRARVALRDERRVPDVHGGRRLRAARALAVGRLGVAAERRHRRAALLASARTAACTTHTLGGVRPVRLEEPVVHVCYYEARRSPRGRARACRASSSGRSPRGRSRARATSPRAIGSTPRRPRTATRLAQLFGDVWEWTRSDYAPYPGFAPAAGALGEYNGKFMCNQRVLRGGSCATPQSHIRASYRNFFPPTARWQFSGIRLARES